MTEISHLVVNGCSFTYCQGLEQPYIDGWPALLAKKLGLPVVNLAMGGNGNDAIYRKTLDYYFKNKSFDSNPLYIIALSHSTRKEEFFKEYLGNELNDYKGLDLGHENINYVLKNLGTNIVANHKIEYHEIAHILNLDFINLEKRKLYYWVSIINHFKSNGIPYLIADYMPTHNTTIKQIVNQDNPFLYDYLYNDKHFMGDLSQIVDKSNKLPCGHDGLKSQIILANKFYDDILNLYPDIKIKKENNSFLTLKNFYNEHQRLRFNYNKWLEHDLLTEQI